jgi:single-strand DNA-binding protein
MLNQVTLTGNLGKDPETYFSGNGEPITKFSLAFRINKEKTGWINVVCFNKLADSAQKYLHKGARIGLIGTLSQNKWETDEGVQKSAFEIICNHLEFIKTDGRGFNQDATGSEDIPI